MTTMNRGHIYLENWYWLLDIIEAETDAGKRSCMNSVQIALAQGVDQTEGAQYEYGNRALKIARNLHLDLIAANIDHMLHDYMYHEYQPSPIDEAEIFTDGFCDPRTPAERAADAFQDEYSNDATINDIRAGF